jgi:hypothetical protein
MYPEYERSLLRHLQLKSTRTVTVFKSKTAQSTYLRLTCVLYLIDTYKENGSISCTYRRDGFTR